MIKKFRAFVKENNLFSEEDKILLAVSGGIDSMVLLDLFIHSNLNFGVAHCNFQLRGKDSDGDENFVADECRKNKIRFHLKRISVKSFAARKKISVQMAARELRFKWFDVLCTKHGYTKISTAHHLDDSIETFLINFSRGSGISVFHSIEEKNGNIVRPLLFARKEEIVKYARRKKIRWREDKSNISDDYLRNKIRHHLIPVLKEINPSIEKTFANNRLIWKESEQIYLEYISILKKQWVEKQNGILKINAGFLKNHPSVKTLVWELLKDFNFNSTTCMRISAMLNSTGKKFFSPTHCCELSRENILIYPTFKKKQKEIKINRLQHLIKFGTAQIELKYMSRKFTDTEEILNFFSSQNKSECVDNALLNYPLKLRTWKKGDYFYPLGMKGKKKLSDFFIDLKLSLKQKEKIPVLESGNRIVAVIGYRIDNRFKITSATEEILQITIHEQ